MARTRGSRVDADASRDRHDRHDRQADEPKAAKEPKEPRRARRDGEMTIDELAAQADMTVRNVRAYSTRGLLPAPRLVGRTGYYNGDHLARLTLVREMLDQGYTLAAAERLITSAPGSGTQALGLYRALMTPWEDTEPEVIDPTTLARLARTEPDPEVFERVVALGLAEWTEDGRLSIANPNLVRAGLEVIAAGIPPAAILDLVPALREHAHAVAALFVEMFTSSVWEPFVDAGMPAQSWARMQVTVETVLPLAGQALLAAFHQSLGESVTEAMSGELGEDLFGGQDETD